MPEISNCISIYDDIFRVCEWQRQALSHLPVKKGSALKPAKLSV